MKLDVKKLFCISIIAIIILSIFPTINFAAEKPELTVKVEKEHLELEEEFTVAVVFNSNNSKDCLGFDFGLKYDSNVLEVVSSEKVYNSASSILYDKNPGSVNFVLFSAESLEYAGELFKVHFKVKSDASGGETALRINSDNSTYPIESLKEGVDTTINAASVSINAPVKYTASPNTQGEGQQPGNVPGNQNDPNNPNVGQQPATMGDTNQGNSGVTFGEVGNTTSSSKTTEADNTQQSGLPFVVVVILIGISVLGVVCIIKILTTKKK